MIGHIRTEPCTVLRRRTRVLFPALACVLLALTHLSAMAGATASIDKSAISSGETVRLEIKIDDEPDSGPDLSVLAPDFQILDRRTSRSVSIINGQRTERHTLVLRLLPRRAGELEIPSIPIGNSATAPLQLSVAQRAAEPTGDEPSPGGEPSQPPPSPTALLEATIDPTEARVGQQRILTVKVFMDGPIRRPRLHDPQLPNADVLPLGEDRYQAQRNGEDYRVYERRYALFPRTAGQLQIGDLLFEGWATGAGGARSGIGHPSAEHRVEARSESLTANVLALPNGAHRDRWLPARNLTLSESGPETYQVRVGEPVERRISLRAEGIMARDLPVLAVQAPYQLAKRQKPPRLWDERRPEGVVGTRQEVISLTSREPGRYRLPPLSLTWWSTENERWETAMLPARELVASAAPRVDSGLPAGAAQRWPQPAPRGVPEKPADTLGTPPERPLDDPAGSSGFWAWIAAALGLAWIVMMATRWRSKQRMRKPEREPPKRYASVPEPTAASEEADPLQDRIEAVRAAYKSGNAGAAREALLAWAGRALPERAPSNLARLAGRCREPLRGQILLLEEAFFSPTPVAWDKQPVWEQLPGFEPAPPQEPASFRRGKPIRRRAQNPDAE